MTSSPHVDWMRPGTVRVAGRKARHVVHWGLRQGARSVRKGSGGGLGGISVTLLAARHLSRHDAFESEAFIGGSDGVAPV